MRESKAIEFRGWCGRGGSYHPLVVLHRSSSPLFRSLPPPRSSIQGRGCPNLSLSYTTRWMYRDRSLLMPLCINDEKQIAHPFFPFSIDRGKRNKAPVTPLKYSNCLLIYSALRYRAIKFISYFTIALKCSLLPVIVKNEIDIHFILDLDK